MIGVRQRSPCVRAIRKPLEQLEDDFIPVDDEGRIEESIEVYVDKLAIADKVFSIKKKEEEESRLGANEQQKELQKEINVLQTKLKNLLIMELILVQRVLRSRRDLQLAIANLNGEGAYQWLEDRWFDQRKEVDELLYEIYEKRKLLAESEDLVYEIETFPTPGSLDWERVYMAQMAALELMIQSMRIKRDVSTLLLTKYTEMRDMIVVVTKNYSRTVPEAEDEMRDQKMELKRMEVALELSEEYLAMEKFDMTITKREITENRKLRAEHLRQFNIKNVKQLQNHDHGENYPNCSYSHRIKLPFEFSNMTKNTEELEEIRKRIEAKQHNLAELTREYGELTRAAHVKTLADVPQRFVIQKEISNVVSSERMSLEELLKLLLRQKEQLLRIQYHLKYTGDNQQKLIKRKLAELKGTVEIARAERVKKLAKAKKRKNATEIAILGSIAVIRRIRECRVVDNNKRKPNQIPDLPATTTADLKKLGKHLKREAEEILNRLANKEKSHDTSNDAEIEAWLNEEDDDPVEARLVRVETPVLQQDHEAYYEIDLISFSVPGRIEIKNENLKFVEEALYHREMGQRCEDSKKIVL